MKLETRSSRIEEIIVTETLQGNGTEKHPRRIVTTYWSKEGELLAVNDSCKGEDEES